MSANVSSKSTTWWTDNNPDVPTLHDAQACLRYLQGQHTPPAGQTEAWERFHAAYAPLIRSFVLAFGVHEADADDCCQEVWKDIFQRVPAFHSDGSSAAISSWLKKIARSKATDALRNRLRHPMKHLGPGAEAVLPSRDAGPAAEYEQRRRQEAVHRILSILRQKLPALSYRAFSLHCFEKKTIKEIAVELNVTPRVVRRRVCKAKGTFTRLCEADEEKDLLSNG
jgi:RNA polymerase sigma-70 factor, ECF subfamily